MTRFLWMMAVLALLGACGASNPRDRVDLVRVETYLATPQRNATIDARAAERCLGRGQRAIHVETVSRKSGARVVYAHLYACEV